MRNKKNSLLITLKKASSHIDKVITMVEDEKYCIDIIQQVNAVIGYLKSAKNQKLAEHLNTCFAKGMAEKSKTKKQKLIKELIQALNMTK